MILDMQPPATSNRPALKPSPPVSPRPLGRPSGYSEERVGRLCAVIRRWGLPDGEAARGLGIPRQTLSRWKQAHLELGHWLAMARERDRDAKLAIVDEAKTADGRPDSRASAWALAKALPEDYGRSGAAARARGRRRRFARTRLKT